MIRTSLFALALVVASSGAAFAATADDQAQTPAATADDAATQTSTTQLTVQGEYPSEPGPHTVIYRQWGDLEG
ncbi:MAG: hypothetical protein JWM77_2164 [Rhodospirillales bacterium]|jgi:hypothetical protein|nr:hypothetical protein [Rhodospirillales bacterium]